MRAIIAWPGIAPAQINLVEHPCMRHTRRQLRQDVFIRGGKTALVVDHQQHPVSLAQHVAGALHTGLFHRVVTGTQAGGINNVQRQAIYLDMLAQQVAGGTRYRRDDCGITAGQHIQQAGLAGIRATGNYQRHAIAQ